MSWSAWVPVTVILVALFVVDWRRFGRAGQPISPAQAARWSIVWLVVGLAFAGVVWVASGTALAGQYLGGYLVERVLSVDNLAVLYVVLGGSGAPAAAQARALTWGLVGALGLRAVLVVAGVALLQVVPGLAAVFGVVLIVTGVRLTRREELITHAGPGRLARWTARVVPSTEDFQGRSVLVRRHGRRLATPLVPLVVAVMAADVVFALDSVPAVLSFSRVTWVVLAANGFALLGLRPLYYLVAELVMRLRYLKHGLGVVLGIAGLSLIGDEFVTVPTWVELVLVVVVLAIAVTASLRHRAPVPAEVPGGAGS
jgi:tellurite resistance protein TerC